MSFNLEYNKKELKQKKGLFKQINNKSNSELEIMFNTSPKQKTISSFNQQTGAEFYNPVIHQNDESFSYQIQMEKQYVQRLKGQREKIQGLYSKYDVILSQMKKKNSEIKEKDEKIKVMDTKIKSLQINWQQISLVKQESKQIFNQNLSLKHRILSLQNQNSEILEHLKLKQNYVTDQKDQLDQINEKLQQKTRILNNRLLNCQEQLKNSVDVQKRSESIKSQYMTQISQLNSQVNLLRNQMIKRDESIHVLKLDNQFLQQKLSDQQQNYTVYLKDLQLKIEKSQKQKKLQIKSMKDIIEQKNCSISTLQSKIDSFKQQLQVKEIDLESANKILTEQKKVFDNDLFELKSQMNNEKNYFREQFMYCQNHIDKIEKKLADSLKRQKDLGEKIRKLETNQAAKRNLRQIQRQQLQKINKILSLQ